MAAHEQKTTKKLGVCYYPEQWDEKTWANDAERMAKLGIKLVRIGEFAWSRLEPSRRDYRFDWLERAVETLTAANLDVVIGTPTATPPKWLVDEMPDMLPVDEVGQVRKFGSRRHYSFSHPEYRRECQRIVTALAERFGNHPGIVAWQVDNEYGCHDTVLSYSAVDLAAFRDWLAQKYQSPDALNRAWGNVFWSMEYRTMNEVELPNNTVTESNPAHWMDYRRFASEQVEEFNRLQVDILRHLAPGRDIIHDFMGRSMAFDHFRVGADLDVSSWNSYPLGFLEDRINAEDDWKCRFSRSGDPDFQAFHHDLYRATSNGRWWVMEQQPGPVNWAPHNPAPREGMVWLWTMEAFAHGAEVVSYFRWRQAPFAQEQMHSGLLRSDGIEAEGYNEAKRVFEDIKKIEWTAETTSKIAIVLDYSSAWAWEIQPQGEEFDYFRLVFDFYKGLRKLGLSIDFVSSQTEDFSPFNLVVIPGLFSWTPQLLEASRNFEGEILIGPRTGSKTENFSIPDSLPPNLPQDILDMKVSRVESLRPDCPVETDFGQIRFWREHIEASSQVQVAIRSADGLPALVRQANCSYVCGWPDDSLMQSILTGLAVQAGITTCQLPDEIRIRQSGQLTFIFNYGDEECDLGQFVQGNHVLGQQILTPAGVSVLQGKCKFGK